MRSITRTVESLWCHLICAYQGSTIEALVAHSRHHLSDSAQPIKRASSSGVVLFAMAATEAREMSPHLRTPDVSHFTQEPRWIYHFGVLPQGGVYWQPKGPRGVAHWTCSRRGVPRQRLWPLARAAETPRSRESSEKPSLLHCFWPKSAPSTSTR
jgi:hypothetical protein